ncbi:iron-enterobactin ABC transporter permease [Chromobacterium piscinae]|uniref:iron-enterobactin ABC transporter permease n=1 Tax=Chromobacterium piscinae TaxID=686831 RepID=UPI001C8C2D89|nr:iron-enterobactin ABC transporter permease [Chromobacterium piscinae]MBX9296553.1 iron-enterobactin ABC transporter permease [Chromobacterium vaccinii]MBX9356130.1 iron-enterobactin ABC transporter permease [Chromobacterium vaccinii]MCD4504136.1 iron-enterobactin ABC transporter permease [Chromobacterium piscinae]
MKTLELRLGHPDGRFNLRLKLGRLWPALLLMAACAALALMSLRAGALHLSLEQVWNALQGRGSRLEVAVVQQWRLPRVAMALAIGAALGMSGAIFQSLLRNPLGSPDVVGFNTGAYTGALLVITTIGGSHFQIAGGALAGGLASAALVYLLAWKRGAHGLRLIIVGIAVSAMLSALNSWLMINASLESAMSAAIWGAGTLNGMTWSKGLPSALFCLLAMLAAMALKPRMRLLEMGDDCASALGVPAERARLMLMGLGVALIASATAAAGPISFIALAAPQIAQRLQRARATSPLTAAWTGALLLLAADYAAQHLFYPRQLPVGVVTICIGGLYLLWLLLRQTGGAKP